MNKVSFSLAAGRKVKNLAEGKINKCEDGALRAAARRERFHRKCTMSQ